MERITENVYATTRPPTITFSDHLTLRLGDHLFL